LAERALLEVFSQRGYRVDVLTYHQGEDVRIANCHVLRTSAVPGLGKVRPGFSAKKLLCDAIMFVRAVALGRRVRYDLVYAVEESVFMAMVLKRLFGTPFVYDMDSSLAQQMMERFPLLRVVGGALGKAEGLAIRESAAVLAVCRELEEVALRHAPGKLVGRAEDASLLDDDTADGERLRDTVGDGPMAMYVGNLEPYQGVDLLIESFVHTVRSAPDARLAVIGGEEQAIRRERLRAEQLGIAASVHFVGPRPVSRLGWYLRQADVLVSPRISGINTPMKIYSYLDSGRPVLATRLPTHTQVIDDEIGVLAEPEPAAFGEALSLLLQDPERGERLARHAKERVEREYSPDAFRRKVSGFLDALEQALPPSLPAAE
jgi:glycosyltransferase involved in cell wall biosynthesis